MGLNQKVMQEVRRLLLLPSPKQKDNGGKQRSQTLATQDSSSTTNSCKISHSNQCKGGSTLTESDDRAATLFTQLNTLTEEGTSINSQLSMQERISSQIQKYEQLDHFNDGLGCDKENRSNKGGVVPE